MMTDNEELVGLLLSRIGQEFDGECHLTEAEARQIATLIEQLHNRVERQRELVAAAKDARDFLWSRTNTTEYRSRADRLTKALNALTGEQ
jgi:hypothetical protein